MKNLAHGKAAEARLEVQDDIMKLISARVQLLADIAQNQAALNDLIATKARAAVHKLTESERKDQG